MKLLLQIIIDVPVRGPIYNPLAAPHELSSDKRACAECHYFFVSVSTFTPHGNLNFHLMQRSSFIAQHVSLTVV
jgi:hypothetical protein